MADYYTNFSVMLPVSDPIAAETWVQKWEVAEARASNCDDEDDAWYEKYQGVALEVVKEGIWLHDDGGDGNLEAAIHTVQKYLQHFGIKGGIFMTWVSYCNKPRINEASGGGVVITSEDHIIVGSHDVLREAADAGIEILNA